eukprot:scaffold93719_cov85-Phaeocystis_antarctica.AAC.4
MKIAYALKGSRGDTQPHVAVAVEVRRASRARSGTPSAHPHPAQLVRAGYEVRLWVPSDYVSLVPKITGLSVYSSNHSWAEAMEIFAPSIASGNINEQLKVLFEEQA